MRLGLCLLLFMVATSATASDWTRFRGPNGSGVSDDGPVPTEWSDSQNLKWKAELPGPGSSSPIVVGDKVFVTCWSGYGTDRGNPGNKDDLKFHLVCLSRKDGSQLWVKDVDPSGREPDYQGNFTQHGYTSHTPVSDGERVYAYFGQAGIYAYDLDGKQLWEHSTGTESHMFGSAASPILLDDLVIIPATIESQSIVAFNKVTGEEAWKQAAQGFSGTWGTPVIVTLADGSKEIVIGVPNEVWGFNPETGKLRWYASAINARDMRSSVLEHDGVIYAMEGRGAGMAAVKPGGKGDVSESNVVWKGREGGDISTPVFYDGKLYYISRGVLSGIDAKTGEQVVQTRLQATGGGDDSANRGGPSGGRGGFGGGRGGFGGSDYSSPVVADGKLYYVKRSGETYVIDLTGDEPKLIATNKFESDSSDFSATPAISDGELFIRSSANLYCVGE